MRINQTVLLNLPVKATTNEINKIITLIALQPSIILETYLFL